MKLSQIIEDNLFMKLMVGNNENITNYPAWFIPVQHSSWTLLHKRRHASRMLFLSSLRWQELVYTREYYRYEMFGGIWKIDGWVSRIGHVHISTWPPKCFLDVAWLINVGTFNDGRLDQSFLQLLKTSFNIYFIYSRGCGLPGYEAKSWTGFLKRGK